MKQCRQTPFPSYCSLLRNSSKWCWLKDLPYCCSNQLVSCRSPKQGCRTKESECQRCRYKLPDRSCRNETSRLSKLRLGCPNHSGLPLFRATQTELRQT